MREIKFRAWNIEQKEWCRDIALWRVQYLNEDTDSPPVVVEQFTGLKDKNGKEVYEGDLVKNNWTRNDGEDIGGVWEVKFGEYDNSRLEYGSSGHIGFYAECLFPDDPDEDQEGLHNLPTNNRRDDFEIIGNVHENSELLKP